MAEATMYFPKDFRWGTATSAYQVEGANTNSDWWEWEQKSGTILHDHRSDIACNWWENAEADLDLAADLGNNAHRMALEWSRIEPEPSVFDSAALNRYREILQAMHARGIEPMVTLHHFSNPLWLVEKGDFDTDVVVDYFQRYTAKVVEALGDLVPLWVTINEPMVYGFMRYIFGKFPGPQKAGLGALGRALRNLLRCHAAAYHTIKAHQPAAQVSVAKNIAIFEALPSRNPLHGWWADQVSWIFNDWWLSALQDGRLRWPLARGRIPNLAGTYDFLGINYYTRFFLHFPRTDYANWPAGTAVSDGQYGEVYPEGLFRTLRHVRRFNKPIYITENGLPDREDKLRSSFIISHLREVWRAVNFSWPVMGYYHWTLVDNFEWDRGWTQRFGLYALNPETGARRLRNSGKLYREICHLGGISSELAEKYAPQLMPKLFPGTPGAGV